MKRQLHFTSTNDDDDKEGVEREVNSPTNFIDMVAMIRDQLLLFLSSSSIIMTIIIINHHEYLYCHFKFNYYYYHSHYHHHHHRCIKYINHPPHHNY